MITLFGKQIDPKSLLAPEDFKAEWREKMSDEEYHADRTAVGSSSLRRTAKSMLSFANSMWGKGETETDAMKFGSLVHLAVLEPQRFKSLLVVQPVIEGYTAKGELTTSLNCKDVQKNIAAWKVKQDPKAVIVLQEEADRLLCMIDSVMSHPHASLLLKNVKTEIAGYARDPITGIRIKIKPDVLAFNADRLSDLKTCKDSYWPEFRRTVENKKYYFQDAQYAAITKQITGIEPTNRAWIAVESQAPFETAVHEVHHEYKMQGEQQFRDSLDKVKAAIDANDFPCRQPEAEMGEPSPFFKKEFNYNEIY